MEKDFILLSEKWADLSMGEKSNEVYDLTEEIINTDERMFSLKANWSGYGTWKSVFWGNSYYFGENLCKVLKSACNGKITHDEDKVFTLEEFRDKIEEGIYNFLNLEYYETLK